MHHHQLPAKPPVAHGEIEKRAHRSWFSAVIDPHIPVSFGIQPGGFSVSIAEIRRCVKSSLLNLDRPIYGIGSRVSPCPLTQRPLLAALPVCFDVLCREDSVIR